MADKLTSEEKLLNLIRKKNTGKDSKHTSPSREDINQDKFEQGYAPAKSGYEIIKFLNRFLGIAIIGILVYILYRNFFTDRSWENEIFNETSVIETSEAPVEIISKANKPFEIYDETFVQRDIFRPPWDKPKQEPEIFVDKTINWKDQFRLSGIVLDKEPNAIIEDVMTNQTIFLTTGESIGDAVLEEIYEDRAVFLINGERVELLQ